MRRTPVENSKGADRRRNVFDIVADLGFLDRKPLSPRLGPPPAEPVATHPPAEPVATPPPALTLVKPQPAPPPAPVELAHTLTEAQQRAAQQRMAAERLLQEAIELEERLADEAAQARSASEQALGRELAAALDNMRAAERQSAEHAEVCSKNLERLAAQRAQAEALQADDRAALAEARRRLESAEAACSESDRRYKDASTAEETARAEAAASSEVVAAHRVAREEMEARLRGIRERAAAVPADAATRIAERRAADAAKRIAERQAADAQRGAAS
jgi:colicin import membrane protein